MHVQGIFVSYLLPFCHDKTMTT